MNLVYVRALPVEAMAATARIGEAAAAGALRPDRGPADHGGGAGLHLRLHLLHHPLRGADLPAHGPGRRLLPALARIHPRYQTPAACILAQGVWSIVLTFSGSYEQLYTYVVFAVVLFHAATGAAVFVLRRTRPEAARPYRTWGYPVVPLVFMLVSAALVAEHPGGEAEGVADRPRPPRPRHPRLPLLAAERPPWRGRRPAEAGPLPARLAAGRSLSRDIAVLTNAIAFNFLLCLFPLLLVVAGFAQRLPDRAAAAGTALLLVLQRADPVRARGRLADR